MITPAQRRLLEALAAASEPVGPGALAFAAGYQGKGRSGAGRAPQWTGRVMMAMPAGLVAVDRRGRHSITTAGRVALTKSPYSWNVCPACKSRATKIQSAITGAFRCQKCNHWYDV